MLNWFSLKSFKNILIISLTHWKKDETTTNVMTNSIFLKSCYISLFHFVKENPQKSVTWNMFKQDFQLNWKIGTLNWKHDKQNKRKLLLKGNAGVDSGSRRGWREKTSSRNDTNISNEQQEFIDFHFPTALHLLTWTMAVSCDCSCWWYHLSYCIYLIFVQW